MSEQCKWRPDTDGVYHSDCGQEFVFTDDGPTQNHMSFCCYCGKLLLDNTRCGQIRYVEATDVYEACCLFPKHPGDHAYVLEEALYDPAGATPTETPQGESA